MARGKRRKRSKQDRHERALMAAVEPPCEHPDEGWRGESRDPRDYDQPPRIRTTWSWEQ
jgi:hypothetical protein